MPNPYLAEAALQRFWLAALDVATQHTLRNLRDCCAKANDDPDGDWDDRDFTDPGDTPSNWQLGPHKSPQKWMNQMRSRGWTPADITRALAEGMEFPAPNLVNPGNQAIRYELSPSRFVVRDEVTKDILQISRDDFNPL